MTAEQFSALVQRLEVAAEKHPRAYKNRVLLLALLGYAYLLAVLAVALGVSLLHPLLFFLAGLPLTILLVRALWVRVPAPPGIPIESQDAPRLFRAIDYVRELLKFPRFHRVVLVAHFNAGVTQIPRLGAFGWHRNYLLLGLPLLMGLSPEQFRAVLAHEFYHLFGAHSRFDNWVYRLRITWNTLMENLERQPRWTFLFRRFFNWYVPLINAHTFVLARQHEYEADRFAADLVGTQPTADALVRMRLWNNHLEEAFWQPLWVRANQQPDPPKDSYAEMRAFLRQGVDSAGETWLASALEEETETEGSHPSLADRLATLGEKPRLPGPLQETAAEHYLAGSLETLSGVLAREWAQQAAAQWRERHAHAQTLQTNLAALAEKAQQQVLSEAEDWNRAYWTEDLYGSDAALPLYRECAARHPQHAGAHYAVGRILLAQGNGEGQPWLEKAISLDADYVLHGCGLLHRYLKAEGRTEEAEAYLGRYRRRLQLLQDAQAQRATIRPGDRLWFHNLSEEHIARLREHLARFSQIAAAYVARKEVTLLPGQPCYLLGIQWRFWAPVLNEDKLLTQLANHILVPGGSLTIISVHHEARLRARLRAVPGSRIYRRPWFARWRSKTAD